MFVTGASEAIVMSVRMAGSGLCGAQGTEPLSSVLPLNPVDSSATGPTSSRLVSLGAPLLEGSYTLCYCAGSDTGRPES